MPKALVPVEHRCVLDVDLRYNFLTGKLTDDRYYGLVNNTTGRMMNIRVRDDELLEIYRKLSQKNTQSLAGYMNDSKNILTF